MRRKYKIFLSRKQRAVLEGLMRKGKVGARKLRRARILLLADDSQGKSKTNREICGILGVSANLPSTICRKFVEGGLESAVHDKPIPGGPVKYSVVDEAKIVALACTEPPKGRARWTLRLLADKAVEVGITEPISHSKIGTVLKKHRKTLANQAMVHRED